MHNSYQRCTKAIDYNQICLCMKINACMHDVPDYLDVICFTVGGESSAVWANEIGRHASQTSPENNKIPSFAESCSEDHTKHPHPKRT